MEFHKIIPIWNDTYHWRRPPPTALDYVRGWHWQEGHWSTTIERAQISCCKSTSASKLASCLSFSRDVIATRRNQSSFTNAYIIPQIDQRPEHSHSNINIVTSLMHNPWEDSVQGCVPHRSMSHAQPQIRFWNHPDRKQRHLQVKQQAPRKSQTLKHKISLMPSS